MVLVRREVGKVPFLLGLVVLCDLSEMDALAPFRVIIAALSTGRAVCCAGGSSGQADRAS